MHERTAKSWTIEADVTPEVAFGYISDVRRHAEWSPKPYRVDPAPALPLKPGSSFQSYGSVPGDKEHANQVEVSVVDSPRVLVLTSTDKGEQYVHRFDIEAHGSGSRVTRTVEAPKPTGFVRLIFPLIFAVFINPEVTKGMRMLKENLAKLG
jgi:uncharacterized protein YndB with AHSA1/START domain